MRGKRGWCVAFAGAPVFVALAIANSAGYRYGVSDLAYYLPAAFHTLDPALFPRDAALLDVQSGFTLADEAVAGALRLGRAVGATDAATIYSTHLATLVLLFAAAVTLARAVFRSSWSVVAFAAALTLRHAVARTGVNTLEGYFHPRMLAFALGILALAAFLRRGVWPAVALALAAFALHTTTGFWFLICLGVAGLVSERRQRLVLLAAGTAAGVAFLYAITAGPLAGRVQPMDAAWLSVIAEKDYLFPDKWPVYAWLTCALYVAAIAAGALIRLRDGQLADRERGLLAGAAALLSVFLIAIPLLVGRSALALQLQPARVFWILDLLATVAVLWLLESRERHLTRLPAVFAVALLIASAARGIYLMTVRFPERSLAAVALPLSPWQDVMRWADRSDRGTHWLAHPNHALLYGTSLRVSGRRDVFIEATKDPAIAMYDRRVAMRVAERLPLVSDFDALSAAALLDLSRRYDLDYVITESALSLPLAYRHAPLNVYRLR
jgi:hypothetical protein